MIELFNFCQVQFWFIECRGFCFAAVEREYCLSFSKPLHFTVVDINRGKNSQDKMEPNFAQNNFCSVIQSYGWVCFFWELFLFFIMCRESWWFTAVSTPSGTAPTHPLLRNNLRLNWHKTCYLKENLHFFLLVHFSNGVPMQSTAFFIHWVETKSQ